MSEWNETCSQAPCNKGTVEPRERRERPRMSDINRAVDKELNRTMDRGDIMVSPTVPGLTWKFGTVPTVDPELYYLLKNDQVGDTEQTPPDKNSPSSLKQLRWAIYRVIDNYYGDNSRDAAETRKSVVEELFKEYTNS